MNNRFKNNFLGSTISGPHLNPLQRRGRSTQGVTDFFPLLWRGLGGGRIDKKPLNISIKETYATKAFSIIEVLIGIFIFSLGLVSVYALVTSTLNTNQYNKNSLIAMNLAMEQLELMRNIRDSNYSQIKKYNQKDPSSDQYDDVFAPGKYYKIENNFGSDASFPIRVEDMTASFGEGPEEVNGKMLQYRLYTDQNGIYLFDSDGNTKTPFYRYVYVETPRDASGSTDNALQVTSKVIWFQKGYHEFELKTILADWKRL